MTKLTHQIELTAQVLQVGQFDAGESVSPGAGCGVRMVHEGRLFILPLRWGELQALPGGIDATVKLTISAATERDQEPGDVALIWSNEHQGWWKPDGMGYTTKLLEAGIFPFAEARRRTWHGVHAARYDGQLVEPREVEKQIQDLQEPQAQEMLRRLGLGPVEHPPVIRRLPRPPGARRVTP